MTKEEIIDIVLKNKKILKKYKVKYISLFGVSPYLEPYIKKEALKIEEK